jgi:hypothetical protein
MKLQHNAADGLFTKPSIMLAKGAEDVKNKKGLALR